MSSAVTEQNIVLESMGLLSKKSHLLNQPKCALLSKTRPEH